MPLSAAMRERDLQFMLGDLVDTLTWKSGPYACARNELTRGQGLHDDAGIWPDDAFQLVVAISAFTGALPAAGDPVTYGGVNFRILQTRKSEDGKALTLVCAET
jgi:hypothetical protein